MKHLSLILLSTLLCLAAAMAAGKRTIETAFAPPAHFNRAPLKSGSFEASLRGIELIDQKSLMAGDGKTEICLADVAGITPITPFANEHDVGVDGIVKLWGEYLWAHSSPSAISFPLDNGQIASWKDWRDGLRPKKAGGRYIFTQVTAPAGGLGIYQDYLSFVAEEMGAIALRRESTIIIYEDSVTAGDLIVALDKNNESHIGMILDACKGPLGERLYLLGTCGTPSTNLYVMYPYNPIQGTGAWFTLDGARYAVGRGARTDLRRVTLGK
jgi:hypothetical protein